VILLLAACATSGAAAHASMHCNSCQHLAAKLGDNGWVDTWWAAWWYCDINCLCHTNTRTYLLLLLLLLSTKTIRVAQNQKTARPPNNVRQCHSSDKLTFLLTAVEKFIINPGHILAKCSSLWWIRPMAPKILIKYG